MTLQKTKQFAVLAAGLAAAIGSQAAIKNYPGMASIKYYRDIGTVALSALEASPKYPNKPDDYIFADLAEIPTNVAENYGAVLEFLYSPPADGSYAFAIAADDNADLWLSTDETEANLKLIAREPEWNPVRSFGATDRRGCGDTGGQKPCANISDPVTLKKGVKYLVRSRVKEAGGGDNLAIAAKLAAEVPFVNEDPVIEAANISVDASDTPGVLGITASRSYGYVDDTIKLSASLYTPPGVTGTISWSKDGTAIAGATTASLDYKITAADAGTESTTHKFKCTLVAGGTTISTEEVSILMIKRAGPVASPGFISVEFFNDITGTAVQGLLDSDKYINNTPDETRVLTALDTPNGYGENYGARITGFITPQESGSYRFFLYSDDASQFYLNSTAGGPAPVPGNDTPIAEETGCCNVFTEPDSPRTSEPIALTAGSRYAFVGLVKEGGGGDYLQVAWRKEGDATAAASLRPIGGLNISGLVEAAGFSVTISQQPTVVPAGDVVEGTSKMLVAAATVVPNPAFLSYQWQKEGANIPGANAASYKLPNNLAVGNHKYKLIATTAGNRQATSDEITVKVVPDTFPPVPKAGIVKKGATFELGVGFDEPVTDATASVQGNYSVSKGTIASFRYVKQSGSAVLALAGVAAGDAVTVTVKGVADLKGNAIPASGATTTATLAATAMSWVGVGGDEANAQKSTTAFSDDVVALGGGDFDLISGGTAHWANYDEQTFVYQEITGDFDVKVRVEFQTAASQWARAGLQFREDLNEGVNRDQLYNVDSNPSGIRMSQNFSSRVNPAQGAPNGDGTFVPGNNSYEQVQRPRAGYNYDGLNAIYNIAGGFGGAPQYPNAWIRLKRSGQKISTWSGTDGVNWTSSEATVTYSDDPDTEENELLADKLFVGPFYAPELSNNDILTNDKMTESGVAKFRQYGPTSGGGGGTPTLSVARDGANAKITYTGTLQAADVVTGPWVDVAGATSPYSTASSAAQRYWRSRN